MESSHACHHRYNLYRPHKTIRHDLPPWPRGLVQLWTQILAILKIQETNPQYQFIPQLPPPKSVEK